MRTTLDENCPQTKERYEVYKRKSYVSIYSQRAFQVFYVNASEGGRCVKNAVRAFFMARQYV